MKKFIKKIIYASLIIFYFLQVKQVHSLIPYYYFPRIENLQKESFSIGKSAYQLLYFGQYEQSLNLAKLAVKIDKTNEKHEFKHSYFSFFSFFLPGCRISLFFTLNSDSTPQHPPRGHLLRSGIGKFGSKMKPYIAI